MLLVQALPAGENVAAGSARRFRDLSRRRRPPELHEEAVRQTSQDEVVLVHYFAGITTGAHGVPSTSRTGRPLESLSRTVSREPVTVTCA